MYFSIHYLVKHLVGYCRWCIRQRFFLPSDSMPTIDLQKYSRKDNEDTNCPNHSDDMTVHVT